ncbi:MAG: hypothetical protein CMG74_05270 [Candidatus Marinimicrobia bacterium]|nr:hypothetical protein [Candidatus Neomarinimicrobiota bacterium]
MYSNKYPSFNKQKTPRSIGIHVLKRIKLFLDFFEEIKMDTSFYWFTIKAAPSNGMHFMTEKEIKLYTLIKK